MHFWSDYEGKTLADVFLLESLLRTEGRSASFATRDRQGRAGVIRLTEALNDQQQMRDRYRAIQSVSHPHLVVIEDYGDAEFEGTPLTYVVTEPTEESLADILAERRLSIEETGEVAISVVGAIEALHASGLVHGLLEPASVLAAGEVIKLRTDCVRVAPSGVDHARAVAEDVFGVADVLHRSLTQQRLEDASDALALPEPYATIVRNVVRGSWGIEQVAGELRRYVRPTLSPRDMPAAVTTGSMAAPIPAGAPTPAAEPIPAAEPLPSPTARTAAPPVDPHGRSNAVAAPPASPAPGLKAPAPGLKAPAAGAAGLASTPSFDETLAAAGRVFDLAAAAALGDSAPAAGQRASSGSNTATAEPERYPHQGAGWTEAVGRPERDRQISQDQRPEPAASAPLSSRADAESPGSQGVRPAAPATAQLPLLYEPEESSELRAAPLGRSRQLAFADADEKRSRRLMPWVAAGAALLVLVLVLLLLVHIANGSSRKAQATPATSQSPALQSSSSTSTAAAAPAASAVPRTVPAPVPSASRTSSGGGSFSHPAGKIWRVVAYTYNREGQAQSKARVLAERHADLHPQVFSATGSAPYLVTLGGGLSEQQAAAMRQRARGEGLARDVYMQNYSH